jgi:hypothetical protein
MPAPKRRPGTADMLDALADVLDVRRDVAERLDTLDGTTRFTDAVPTVGSGPIIVAAHELAAAFHAVGDLTTARSIDRPNGPDHYLVEPDGTYIPAR